MVVFTTTSGALSCAEAMQQGIERHNKTAPEPLSVRIGLSHGEVTEDSGDYFGDPVVEAARLCSAAKAAKSWPAGSSNSPPVGGPVKSSPLSATSRSRVSPSGGDR